MARFEQFKPILRPGKAIPHGQKIVYETEAPFDQIVLPIETVDFILLCDGSRSVGEIVELIYHKRGTVQFRSLFKTLVYLKDRGFLLNPDQLELPNQNEQKFHLNFLQLNSLFELSIGQRIFNEKDRPLLFYIFSMFSILTAILTINSFEWEWLILSFIYLDDSFITGGLFLFCGASILLSLKNFFKCFLLLFLTGRAYNFRICYSGIALYFRVKSDSLFLISNKLFLTLFHLAVVLSYFPIIGAMSFLFPEFPYYSQAMSLAVVLLLMDLNPFQESELAFLLKSFFNDDTISRISNFMKERPLLSLIHPFESNKDYNLYFFYAHFALAWGFVFSYVFIKGSIYHFEHLTASLKTASWNERLFTIAVATFIIASLSVALINLYRLVLASLLVPLTQMTKKYVRSRKSEPVVSYKHKDILRILEELPMFSHLSTELLNMIVTRSQLKIYKKDAPVIIQGDIGTHLYVLVTGQLQVRKRSPGFSAYLSAIFPVSIFGEVAVIEETRRSADVIAIEDSIIFEVPARMLREISAEAHHSHELDAFKNAILVNQFFTSAPVFRDLPDNVRQNFITRGRIEKFQEGQVIFKQGDIGDSFYLLLRGTAGVTVNGRPVSKIQQGGFFGEISMIADVPRTATIHAVNAIDVLKLTREAFWEILSLDIRIAMFIESVGEMRVREDMQILDDTNSNKAS